MLYHGKNLAIGESAGATYLQFVDQYCYRVQLVVLILSLHVVQALDSSMCAPRSEQRNP